MATKKTVKNTAPAPHLPRFVIDAGNAFVKTVIGKTENVFVHSMAELLPHEYDSALNRYGKTAALDFLRIEGSSFVVGGTAENFNTTRRTGAPKYDRDYYGLLFSSAIARTFINEPEALRGGLRVMASHASKDYEFHKRLIASIKGNWKFECGGVQFNFTVTEVQTYEEPFGSYAKRAFVKDRRGNWTTPLFGKAVGVIDIGGGTCGTLEVDEQGVVKYGTAASAEQGINAAVQRLKSMLKTDFQDFFQQGAVIPEARVRAALATGVYVGGGREIPCAEQVQLSLNPLLNEVKNMYTVNLNGGTGLDTLILTGGGNETLANQVAALTGHGDIILADELGSLQPANARGASQFANVMEEAQI